MRQFVLGCAVGWVVGTGVAMAQSVPRLSIPLTEGWKFLREEVPGAEKPDWDDSRWETVSLPHTWNGQDAQDGGGNYHMGTGWYRLRYTPQSRGKDQRCFLRFDAVSVAAEVYINGQLIGKHLGAYSAFCFDVTSWLTPGKESVIAVKANNQLRKLNSPCTSPSYWNTYGGIYRPVRLIVTDSLQFTPLHYASSGVYIQQKKITRECAEIEVLSKVRNAGKDAVEATLSCAIQDADGKIVAQSRVPVSVAAGAIQDATLKFSVQKPHLWDGVRDPYLYQVEAILSDKSGVRDMVRQSTGFRYYEITLNDGFFLNGKNYLLRGAGYEQDWFGKGWAMGEREREMDVALMREMGATGMMAAHYQHADYFYELSDQAGLVLWSEIPLDGAGGNDGPFKENSLQQLTECMWQLYNHPSFMIVCLCDEFWTKTEDFKHKIIQEMHETAKRIDPSRITANADGQHAPIDVPLHFTTEVFGHNRFDGWYRGSPQSMGPDMDKIHSQYPQLKYGLASYGCGGCIDQHQIPPKQPNPRGPFHPEEWQTFVHEAHLTAINERPWVWGAFFWCMFDFGVDGWKEGSTPGRNTKGVVTIDRKVKKDAFFFCKANWNAKEPTLHIASRRYTPRPVGKTEIKLYSNCTDVSLTLNGQPLPVVQPNRVNVYYWTDVTLVPGTNTAVAKGQWGGKPIIDTVEWIADPSVVSPGPSLPEKPR